MVDIAAFTEMLRQLVGVGSIELKMNVPGEQRGALRALQLDTLRGRIREVVFFDTPELTLFNHGVVVRARRTQGRPDDTVVKLRPVQPDQLAPELRDSKNLKVEMDVTRSSYVVSASMKGSPKAGAVREAFYGRRSPKRVLSKEQRAFLADNQVDGVGYEDLVPLGPVFVVVLKFVPEGIQQRMTIEQWHFPNQVPLLELSTKAEPGDVARTYSEASDFLQKYGLRATGEQEPKTRRALQFLSKRAAAEAQIIPTG